MCLKDEEKNKHRYVIVKWTYRSCERISSLGLYFLLSLKFSVRERSACQKRHSHSFLPKAKGFFFLTEEAVLYGAVSTKERPGKPAAIGVLTYFIPDMAKTLAVMWADPYVDNNYWNIHLYDGEKEANSDMFSYLHDHGRIVSYKTEHINLGSGLQVTGSISRHNLTELEIHVYQVLA